LSLGYTNQIKITNSMHRFLYYCLSLQIFTQLHYLGFTGDDVCFVFFISDPKSEKSINPFSLFDNHFTLNTIICTFAVDWLGADSKLPN